MLKETMTPRERWLAVLKRAKPDRVPMDYWATSEATAQFMKHLGCASHDDFYRRLHIDKLIGVGPGYAGPKLEPDTDVFGCKYADVSYGAGIYRECVFHSLAGFSSVAEIERNFAWPQADWWDFSNVAAAARKAEQNPIRAGGSEPLLTYKSMRGQEQALVDMIENPELVHYCLDKLFDLAYARTERLLDLLRGRLVLTYVAEDMGGQEDLMFSPGLIREFLIPRMKRMIALAHQGGAYVVHHNDGAVRKIIPDMIEAGIDILNPIQWRCKGMEREGLKRDFGDKLIFHGAVDNQQTLPFGSAADVRREVMDNLRILGAGGGYILAPCHNIQSVTPPENIVAMYETGYEHGWQ